MVVCVVGFILGLQWLLSTTSDQSFVAEIQSWLNDPEFSVKKAVSDKAVFVFEVTTRDKATVTISWPKDHKESLSFRLVSNLDSKKDFANLKPEIKDEILSKMRVELLKMDIGFKNLDSSTGDIILEDSIPVKELRNKLSLQEKVIKMDRASKIYGQMLSSELQQNKIKTEQHVLILPDRLKFSGSSKWDMERSIEIKNTSSNTLYMIVIKLQPVRGIFEFKDIDTSLESPDPALIQDIGGIRTNYDLVTILGFETGTKKPLMYFQLYRLKESESKFIRIKKKGVSVESPENALVLSLTALSVSNQAPPVASMFNEGGAVQIKIPERIDYAGCRIMMSRIAK